MTPEERARALVLGCCRVCGTPRKFKRSSYHQGETEVICPNCYPNEATA